MRSARLLLGIFLLTCWGCENIEDATPANRNTFIRFYEAAHNLSGVGAEQTPEGGYIILGNEILANGATNSVVIRTNAQGQRIAQDVMLPGGVSKALKPAIDGYYVIGDSIKTNLESGDVSVFDLFIYSARLFKLNLNGEIVGKVVMADHHATSNITDVRGGAVTVRGDNEVLVLGTSKKAGLNTTEKPFLTAFDPITLTTVWHRTYEVIDRDYVNTKSVHIDDFGKIVWATALLRENQNFSRTYIGVPYMEANSTFENFSQFGEQTDQQLYPNDIQPAHTRAFGYGVVGTYATPAGLNSNMFFMRINQQGDIIEGSERYFDGELSADNAAVTATESESEDTGDAIISTRDGGYVLAGSMLTTPDRGNGGKDILLIKVDGQGNVVWNKLLGGSGNETVASIRETTDGGLLICGTNDVSGLSSIFIMKTDSNGDLTD